MSQFLKVLTYTQKYFIKIKYSKTCLVLSMLCFLSQITFSYVYFLVKNHTIHEI